MRKTIKVAKKTSNRQQKTELLQLQKDWESAKKRIVKELSKEKDATKKSELQLTLDYLKDNYVDVENSTINSKQEKKSITNACGPKEFQATAQFNKASSKKLWRS